MQESKVKAEVLTRILSTFCVALRRNTPRSGRQLHGASLALPFVDVEEMTQAQGGAWHQ